MELQKCGFGKVGAGHVQAVLHGQASYVTASEGPSRSAAMRGAQLHTYPGLEVASLRTDGWLGWCNEVYRLHTMLRQQRFNTRGCCHLLRLPLVAALHKQACMATVTQQSQHASVWLPAGNYQAAWHNVPLVLC